MVANPAAGAIDEVSVQDTWSRLAKDPKAVLIDVRTKAEWAFVGVPDLDTIGKKPILIEWHGFPDNRVHADFTERLAEVLREIGANEGSELMFLCRSGGRSLMAARAMSAAGFTRCRNVTHGFEGPLDATRHRGKQEGWKARNLPWTQG